MPFLFEKYHTFHIYAQKAHLVSRGTHFVKTPIVHKRGGMLHQQGKDGKIKMPPED